MRTKKAILEVLEDTSLDHVSKILTILKKHRDLRGDDSLPNQNFEKESCFFFLLSTTSYFWSNSARVRDPKDWEDLAPQVFAVIREYIESDIIEYDNWDKYIELDNTLQKRWNETYYKYPRSLHEGDKS